MYFLFSPEPRYRDDGEFAAVLVKDSNDIHVPQTVPEWWEAKPLLVPPSFMTFEIDSTQPLLDNFDTAVRYDIYSERLIALLMTSEVRFETFPTKLIDFRTKSMVSDKYKLFHLLEIYPALDADRSRDEGRRFGYRRLALNQKVLQNPRPLFRIAERMNLVLIHEDLKAALEAAGITGCRYTPVEDQLW